MVEEAIKQAEAVCSQGDVKKCAVRRQSSLLPGLLSSRLRLIRVRF